MNRREFQISSICSALMQTGSSQLARAGTSKNFTSVVDKKIIVPSPIAFDFMTCRMLRDQISSISNTNVAIKLGIASSDQTSEVRIRVLAELDRELAKMESEVLRIRDSISTLDRKQIEQSQEVLLDALAIFMSIVLGRASNKLQLVGAVLLTAYSLTKYAYQTLYRDVGVIDTISVVTSTRNSSIGIIANLTQYKMHRFFEHYSTTNEIFLFFLGMGVYADGMLKSMIEKHAFQQALTNIGSEIGRLRFFIQKALSTNSDFLEFLDFCKMMSVEALNEFRLSEADNQCRVQSTVDLPGFFRILAKSNRPNIIGDRTYVLP